MSVRPMVSDFNFSANSFPSDIVPSPQEIENYLNSADVSAEKEIENFERIGCWRTYELLFIGRAEYYEAIAERSSAQEARAIYFCKAKKLVEAALLHHSASQELFEELALKEAQACKKASEDKGTSSEGRLWLLRGAITLYDPMYYASHPFTKALTEKVLQNLNQAAVLWHNAAENYHALGLNADWQNLQSEFPLLRGNKPLSLAEASCACYSNAASILLLQARLLYDSRQNAPTVDNLKKLALEVIETAISLLKTNLPKDPPLLVRFSEKIVNLQRYRYSLLPLEFYDKMGEKEEVFQGYLKIVQQYGNLAQIQENVGYCLAKQVLYLQAAAFFCENLEVSINLLKKAQSIAQSIEENYPSYKYPHVISLARPASSLQSHTLYEQVTGWLTYYEKKLKSDFGMCIHMPIQELGV